jgi:hypothetical protein
MATSTTAHSLPPPLRPPRTDSKTGRAVRAEDSLPASALQTMEAKRQEPRVVKLQAMEVTPVRPGHGQTATNSAPTILKSTLAAASLGQYTAALSRFCGNQYRRIILRYSYLG